MPEGVSGDDVDVETTPGHRWRGLPSLYGNVLPHLPFLVERHGAGSILFFQRTAAFPFPAWGRLGGTTPGHRRRGLSSR